MTAREVALCTLALAASCNQPKAVDRSRATAADGVAIGISASEAQFVRNIANLQGPESAKYDSDQDVWFITNMTGAGSVKDGNGYIVRTSAANPDSSTVFAQGGQNGVVLDSPKGTALHGDTLWVADISALRGFDRHTGAPLATIELQAMGAVQLNDISLGPDGALHVTDTGIMMTPKGVIHVGPDRVFVIGANRKVSVLTADPQVTWPNGIAWNAVTRKWNIASFDPFHGRVFEVSADGRNVRVLRDGSGRVDGLEILSDGSLVYTSWADSSVHLLENGADRTLIRQVPEPADIGVDTRRNQIAIPLSVLGRVEIWSLGTIGRRAPH